MDYDGSYGVDASVGGKGDTIDLVEYDPQERYTKEDGDDAGLIVYYEGEASCKKNLLLAFRHPVIRMSVAVAATALNFLAYGNDPISYSEQEAKFYGLGRVFNFAFTNYPSANTDLMVARLLLLFASLVIGVLLGMVAYAVLSDVIGARMFKKGKGNLVVISSFVLLTMFSMTYFYNVIVEVKSSLNEKDKKYKLTDAMGTTETNFSFAAAVATWVFDYLNVFSIFDTMLQDLRINDARAASYGCAGKRARGFQDFWAAWRTGAFYVLTFCVFAGTVLFVVSEIAYGWMGNQKGRGDWDQYSRIITCASIVALDIVMFVQDWDFPDFSQPGNKIKIVGCWGRKMGCKSNRFPCKITFSGKWVNFGALIFLLILDVNMLINQVTYVPKDYLQTSDVENRVRNVYGSVDPSLACEFANNGFRYAEGSNFLDFDCKLSRIDCTRKGREEGETISTSCVASTFDNATSGDEKSDSSFFPSYSSDNRSSVPFSKIPELVELRCGEGNYDFAWRRNYTCYNVSDKFSIKYVEPTDPYKATLSSLPVLALVIAALVAAIYGTATKLNEWLCHSDCTCVRGGKSETRAHSVTSEKLDGGDSDYDNDGGYAEKEENGSDIELDDIRDIGAEKGRIDEEERTVLSFFERVFVDFKSLTASKNKPEMI
jgi:TMEM117 protein family